MSVPLRMCVGHFISPWIRSPPWHHLHGWIEIDQTSIPISSSRRAKSKQSSNVGHHHPGVLQPPRCTAANDNTNPNCTPYVHENAQSKNNEKGGGKSFPSGSEILNRLRRYGISGILSYGLLNTAYYLMAFLLVWFYVAPAPGKMGYWAAVERFVKIMAMVWAGSQVTKLVRAGGALALAPFVDRGLSWFTIKFRFESQGKAFMAIVGCCFGLAVLLFFVVTLLSA